MMTNFEEFELYRNELIDNLNLSAFSWHCLKQANITSIYDLIQHTGESLSKTYMISTDCINEIRRQLKSEYGLTLSDENPENNPVKQAATVLDMKYSKDALFLTDAMLRSHMVVDEVAKLSEDYGIHTIILLDKLPEFAQKSLSRGVRGEDELLSDALNQLKDYIIELADKGMVF